jgi:hypothetical protein
MAHLARSSDERMISAGGRESKSLETGSSVSLHEVASGEGEEDARSEQSTAYGTILAYEHPIADGRGETYV